MHRWVGGMTLRAAMVLVLCGVALGQPAATRPVTVAAAGGSPETRPAVLWQHDTGG